MAVALMLPGVGIDIELPCFRKDSNDNTEDPPLVL